MSRPARRVSCPPGPVTVATTSPVSRSGVTEETVARGITRMPSSANTPLRVRETSGSSWEASRDRTTMVTIEPRRAKS